MLRIPAGARGNAARLRTNAPPTPPAVQYSTPFHYSILSGFSFRPTLLAVPMTRPASRYPGAPSAPVCAPVLRRSIRPRRGPCTLCLWFSSVSAITTSASTASCVPALPCAPAPLCSLPPLLVSVTPSPYPPPPLSTPLVHLPCSSPRIPSARPSRTPLAPGSWRLSVLLPPGPTRRPRTNPPAATALATSEPWASSPSPGDSLGSPPGAPLPAYSSTAPPPSQAPFPWASLPCRPGR